MTVTLHKASGTDIFSHMSRGEALEILADALRDENVLRIEVAK